MECIIRMIAYCFSKRGVIVNNIILLRDDLGFCIDILLQNICLDTYLARYKRFSDKRFDQRIC